MKKVRKVIMYVFRRRNGDIEFLCVHRKKGDCVVITGHVGDFIPGEKDRHAVKREIKEELEVETLKIWDLKYQNQIALESTQQLSDEHGYLAEVPDQDIKYLKGEELVKWHKIYELEKVLSYKNQKGPIDKIRQILEL